MGMVDQINNLEKIQAAFKKIDESTKVKISCIEFIHCTGNLLNSVGNTNKYDPKLWYAASKDGIIPL